MKDEWGPWIDHDGKGCPVPNGTWVHVLRANGVVSEYRRGSGETYGTWAPPEYSRTPTWWHWPHPVPAYGDIIRYRIRKPRGLTILESLLENLPDEVDA